MSPIQIIELDVGGIKCIVFLFLVWKEILNSFQKKNTDKTSLSTLRSVPSSMLGAMFSGRFAIPVNIIFDENDFKFNFLLLKQFKRIMEMVFLLIAMEDYLVMF